MCSKALCQSRSSPFSPTSLLWRKNDASDDDHHHHHHHLHSFFPPTIIWHGITHTWLDAHIIQSKLILRWHRSFFRHISSFVRCSIRVVYYIPKKLFSDFQQSFQYILKTCHKRKSGPFVWFSLQLTEQNQAILLHQLTCAHTRMQPQRRNNLILRQLDCNAS